MQCKIHNTFFHSFCPDCMEQSTSRIKNTGAVSGTIYGAGPSDSYYPPGAGTGYEWIKKKMKVSIECNVI